MESRSKANLAANIILFAAVATFTVLLVRHLISNREYTETSLSSDGQRVSIAGVDLSPFPQTLIVVLDKNCRFCKQQIPFYRRLAESSRAQNMKLIFAFPHNLNDGINYLQAQQIAATEVIRIRLKSLDIRGTPTVFLLNHEGKILAKWVGELSRPVEDYIISILGMSEQAIITGDSPFLRLGNQRETPVIQPADLLKRLAAKTVTVIDIDDRKDFAQKHIGASVNIPEDELYSRALNELSESASLVLFSRGLDAHKIRNAELVLRSLGFKEVEWLKVTMDETQEAGF